MFVIDQLHDACTHQTYLRSIYLLFFCNVKGRKNFLQYRISYKYQLLAQILSTEDLTVEKSFWKLCLSTHLFNWNSEMAYKTFDYILLPWVRLRNVCKRKETEPTYNDELNSNLSGDHKVS